MHDPRTIRDDPQGFAAQMARRGVAFDATAFAALDGQRRGSLQRAERAQAERNHLAKEIGSAFAAGERDRGQIMQREVAALKIDSAQAEKDAADAEVALNALLATLPNLPAPQVPDGADETQNVIVSHHGTPAELGFEPREHDAIGLALGMDFDAAAAVAGSRFVYLKGQVARLSRAIAQFMLDFHVERAGYTEVAPPLLVRSDAMFGTGQLPKFADDLFHTTDDRWLIPTAEVSLANYVRGRILSEAELPLRFVALTPCFRAEAGAAGRDTRGLIRQHQFEKVELVSITAPHASDEEHERMTRSAESVLEALELPYRRMLLCAGDMGFTAARTYDLEVWLPGQRRYREISSCSTCTDFQARRMDARYRPTGEKKGTRFVHTLNGSGVAVGRALVAVIENYQTADGAVRVPDALLSYTRGMDVLEPA
ncbi:serine--tRNA ligase [Sphingomonas sp.]|uniref:serine--tRNA ligase n=1 Tax=Sphingomonas sp. TaxID=28214 RepID=UPI003AFFD470